MVIAKILLVDDDETVRFTLSKVLESQNFNVTTATGVLDALRLISTQNFDILLSDLHMPGAGDGLTVVSAMRHANPRAVTLLLSAFPEMTAATNAIVQQADEILVKPIDISSLVNVMNQRLLGGPQSPRALETVAEILERTSDVLIQDWMKHVELEERLMAIPMTIEERSGHLRELIRDLISRLRSFKPLGTKELRSIAAEHHGLERRKQGYSAALLVEESRLLQVSIFRTLQNNLSGINFSVLLIEVMTIADEVDSQLGQAMTSYISELSTDELPTIPLEKQETGAAR
jgi:DNA-binding response OmpR family regulator